MGGAGTGYAHVIRTSIKYVLVRVIIKLSIEADNSPGNIHGSKDGNSYCTTVSHNMYRCTVCNVLQFEWVLL